MPEADAESEVAVAMMRSASLRTFGRRKLATMALVINGRFLTRPVTGVERFGRMLLNVIAREWPNSHVVLPRQTGNDVDACGLEVVRQNGLGGHAWEQLQLPYALRKDDLLLSPANTGPLLVKRQVVVVHDLAVIHHPEWFDQRFAHWYGFVLPRLTRRAARVITVSEETKKDLERTYALPEKNVAVVQAFAHGLSPLPAAHTGTKSPYLLVVASRDPRKGLDRIIAWYEGLQVPPFQLIIVGRQVQSFRTSELRTVHGVHFRSDVDDAELHALYAHAIALVHLSRYEGFGLPVLEAMNAGCPVIAMDLPVLRSNFGDAVQYVPVNDLGALLDLVRGLMDPSIRERHVLRGHQCAAGFTIERMAQALHDVLDPLLEP